MVGTHVLDGLWDQEEGSFYEGEPCCVGAKLAGAFDVAKGLWDDYEAGILAFAEQLGGNKAHVLVMLRDAGAGNDPFSTEPWPNDRETVWKEPRTDGAVAIAGGPRPVLHKSIAAHGP